MMATEILISRLILIVEIVEIIVSKIPLPKALDLGECAKMVHAFRMEL